MRRYYYDLIDLTCGHETGAIRRPDGSIWIGNWSFGRWATPKGIPTRLAGLVMGLGEIATARRVPVPPDVICEMQEYDRKMGRRPKTTGYRAWQVGCDNDERQILVVINKSWE